MEAVGLRCIKCGKRTELVTNYSCESCGGILEVEYDYNNIPKLVNKHVAKGLWRFAELLPVNSKFCTTLGEGDTPLLKASKLARWLGLENLYLKNEGCNPTGSFKDRPMTVGISKALESGIKTAITASSGNGGASLAAYAARFGLRAIVVVPEKTPLAKVNQALIHGAQLVKVRGAYSNSFHVAKEAAEKFGWINMTTTFINPYTVEGNKTISYEIIESLEGKTPDWIFIPVGAGPMLVGIWRGMLELKTMGRISKLPKLVAVQSERCCPIEEAFRKGAEEVEPWEGECNTVASGIADALRGYSQDGTLTLKAVNESGGSVVTVSEEEIWQSVKLVAATEGIYAEPTGGVAAMAIRKLIAQGIISYEQTVVGIISGNGLKSSQLPPSFQKQPPVVDCIKDMEDLFLKGNCGIR